MDRKQILECLLETIACISDKNYQKRVWINAEGPEVDSFDETVCIFLDELEAVLKDYQQFKITAVQYPLLKKLFDEFDLFSQKNSLPELFIDTPEWTRITEMAKEVLGHFKES